MMPRTSPSQPSRPRARSIAMRRGAVLVEYALLLVAVGIPTMVGISAGGVKMYANYQRERAITLQNTP
jgi:hypothetical protein